jgi:hypothetical protein
MDHISLSGPDLAGSPLANTIVFAPPVGKVAAGPFEVGRVLSSNLLANGLELTQTVGMTSITSKLTFPSKRGLCAMRFRTAIEQLASFHTLFARIEGNIVT